MVSPLIYTVSVYLTVEMQAGNSITKKTKQEDSASEKMAVLPSITDILARESAAPLLPLPPLGFNQTSNLPRSNSFPMLSVDQLLLNRALPYNGPVLAPLNSVTDESTFSFRAHEQLLTPPLTVSSCSSVCSMDSGIDADVDGDGDGDIAHVRTLLDLPEPKLAAAVNYAKELLHDPAIKPAYNQGWFKPTSPTNKFSKRIEERISGKSLDELVDGFFRRDESRELYGERVSKPRRPMKKLPLRETQGMEELDPELMAKKRRRQEADEAHRIAENDRRDRHRESQMESHRRCPDLAAECGAEHARAEKKTRIQSGKGPGKDDQLWTAIYAHEMAGRVVQTVNDRRKQAEMVVQLLLQALIRQQDLLDSARRSPSQCDSSYETVPSPPGYVGRKRTRDDRERD
ncbi:uncharacterized protein Z520_09843 [Fonsecaea multimorphosa CBS 102226]|uniref:Uncharacterized protein n=1 Tax=Fonsecaea multimorphosa CBS 102226 TaxID=1442371 RepID=A0A0D2JMD1_9EURO|nr:uncharacterized protein Z520_09843 [Fonsecaea multimorphosa CBS 102226]KIX94457.1 hypothetical protein Z520_09843 [Fonsecaea multimorphosa CBS 102226]OAL20037.1 hypothetical protein AYO22_09187 [Fonsecaea multimorphosa]